MSFGAAGGGGQAPFFTPSRCCHGAGVQSGSASAGSWPLALVLHHAAHLSRSICAGTPLLLFSNCCPPIVPANCAHQLVPHCFPPFNVLPHSALCCVAMCRLWRVATCASCPIVSRRCTTTGWTTSRTGASLASCGGDTAYPSGEWPALLDAWLLGHQDWLARCLAAWLPGCRTGSTHQATHLHHPTLLHIHSHTPQVCLRRRSGSRGSPQQRTVRRRQE